MHLSRGIRIDMDGWMDGQMDGGGSGGTGTGGTHWEQ